MNQKGFSSNLAIGIATLAALMVVIGLGYWFLSNQSSVISDLPAGAFGDSVELEGVQTTAGQDYFAVFSTDGVRTVSGCHNRCIAVVDIDADTFVPCRVGHLHAGIGYVGIVLLHHPAEGGHRRTVRSGYTHSKRKSICLEKNAS